MSHLLELLPLGASAPSVWGPGGGGDFGTEAGILSGLHGASPKAALRSLGPGVRESWSVVKERDLGPSFQGKVQDHRQAPGPSLRPLAPCSCHTEVPTYHTTPSQSHKLLLILQSQAKCHPPLLGHPSPTQSALIMTVTGFHCNHLTQQ